MSSSRNTYSSSSYNSSERDHDLIRPGSSSRYTMSHEEEYASGLHYQAPSLSDHKSSGLSTGLSDDIPDDEYSNPNPTESYTSGNGVSAASSSSRARSGDGFVTELPRTRRGLTGKISTLFRRESSRERAVRQDQSSPAENGVRRKKAMKTGSSQAGASRPRPSSRRRRSAGRGAGEVGHTSSIETPSAVSKEEEDTTHENLSVGSRSHTTKSSGSQRIFYSGHADDGSDDSYESRKSKGRQKKKKKEKERNQSPETVDTAGDETAESSDGKTIVRYRGFSTSIKSLFLDETVVCPAMGCFGLILSNRTEYLLNLRNERRGALKRHQNIERKKLPSRIVAYGLLVTIILLFATFLVWGSGNGLSGNPFSVKDSYDKNGDDLVEYDNNNKNGNDDYYSYNGNKVDDDNAWNNNGGNNNNQGYNNNQQYNNGNDNGNYYNNDDANANNYNDDANANNKNNDDANANYDANQNANDDNNNDDANANYDAYQNANDENDNDDANANYNDNQNYDANHNAYNAYNNYNNGGNRRIAEEDPMEYLDQHPFNGIYKLRDYHENLWLPLSDFIQQEWYLVQDDNAVLSRYGSPRKSGPGRRQRRMEDGNNNQGSGSNGNYQNNGGNNQNDNEKSIYGDLASNIRFALFFTFLLFLGFLGRRRRMRTRFYLVRARAQEDHLFYASTQVGEAKKVKYENSREDQYEGACSHTLCGCYPVDDVVEEEEVVESVEVTDSGIFKRKKKHHNEDVVARAFNFLMALCCGVACKCWLQCMSVCALAQEAREIRLLVPARYQRIDFITHQPFHEYQKDVNDLRRGWLGKSRKKAGIRPHWNALSRLSRYILVTSLIAISTIVGTLVFNPRVAFSWPDAVVLGATFLQSFLVLFIVHGIFHKSDLSLDAVIKMFAAGFLIAIPSAFFFEGLLANFFLFLGYTMYELVVWIGGSAAASWVYDKWHFLWFLGELFNAYMVAAVTEELCKYYTFRAVEHPDLVFLTGLSRTKKDQAAIEGGLVKYPFASHQVQELNRTGSFGDLSQYSHRSSSSKRSRSKKSKDMRLIERTGTMEEEFDEDESDVRTYRQKAMAITTGMISLAVGLACAENFLYVFVFGGTASMSNSEDDRRNELLEEWIILVFRSIFPIHALSAALQSINMIRKFVETDGHNGHRIGVGRILLPAVFLHGTFDAVLMGVNFYQETSWESYLKEHNGKVDADDEGPYNPIVVNVIAWIGITTVMLAGIIWYYRENRQQRDRLKLLEEKVKARKSLGEDTSWDSPDDEEEDEHNVV